jgi:hypothetical protein
MLDATHALTILAELAPARARDLPAILDAIDAELGKRDDLPDTHFMRLVIVDDAQGRNELAPLLAWESNYDGPVDDYLIEIFAAVPRLDAAFACCAGYPAGGVAERDEWLRWFHARKHRAAAFYTGYRGVPRREVKDDAALHDALRDAVDRERPTLGGLAPSAVQGRLIASVRATHPELDTSLPGSDELRWFVSRVLAVLLLLALLPLILVCIGPWYWALRKHEEADVPDLDPRPVYDDSDQHADEDEDGVAQNQLTHLVDIKPGWFRLVTAFIVLSVIDLAAAVVFVRGALGGITDIHFARWVIILDRRTNIPDSRRRHRLLFFSNYDGSWESYLGEFVDRASSGLTGVWSNTVGFPRTRGLVNEGSRDEEAFKSWTRKHQIHTEVWWTGVPTSTVENIRDNIDLRRGFAQPGDDDAAKAWLEIL